MAILIFKKALLFVFLHASLFQSIYVQGCDTTLRNTVVYAGNSTSFPHNDNIVNVKWQVAPSSSTFNSLMDINPYYNNTVDPQFLTTYAVNNSQLTIFQATGAPQGPMPYSTSGLYLLNYPSSSDPTINDCTTGAALIVILSGPNCTCDASNPNNVLMTCSLDFANFVTLRTNPIMTWIHGGTTVFQESPQPTSTDLNNPGLQTVTSTFSPPYLDGTPYEFQLTFSGPDTSAVPPYVDPNPPDFNVTIVFTECVITTTMMTTTMTTTKLLSTTTTIPPPCGQSLVNTVVYEGNSTYFQRANDGQLAKWQVAPSSSNFNSLMDINPYYNNTVTPQFLTTYAVNNSQLTIFNSTTAPQGTTMPYSTAGLYVLDYQNNSNCNTGAGLIVIKSGPVCSIDLSNPNQPALTCSVEFANYIQQQINPIMTWSNGSGVVRTDTPDRTSLDLNNPGLQSATSYLPISPIDANTYQCNLTFSAPSSAQPSFIATNAPTFSATCVVTNTAVTTTTISSTITTTQPATTTTPSITTTPSVASSPPSTLSSSPSTISSSVPSTISSTISSSSSSAPLLTSPSVPTPPTPSPTSPASAVTSGPTVPATTVYDGQQQAIAILLSLLLCTPFAAAVVCCCWCWCCCPFGIVGGEPRRFFYPFGTEDRVGLPRRRRRVRRIHRIVYYRTSYPSSDEEATSEYSFY